MKLVGGGGGLRQVDVGLDCTRGGVGKVGDKLITGRRGRG